jgi:hypothetical protein
MIKQRRRINVLATIAALVLVASLVLSVNAALADASARRCQDTKGSTLAMHSRVLCLKLSAAAAREHPRWSSNVDNSCRYVARSSSTCTWRVSYPGHRSSCNGDATVTGIRHVRVSIFTTQCASSVTARSSRSSWG